MGVGASERIVLSFDLVSVEEPPAHILGARIWLGVIMKRENICCFQERNPFRLALSKFLCWFAEIQFQLKFLT